MERKEKNPEWKKSEDFTEDFADSFGVTSTDRGIYLDFGRKDYERGEGGNVENLSIKYHTRIFIPLELIEPIVKMLRDSLERRVKKGGKEGGE